MPGWTLVDTHLTQGRIFQRPLDTTELGFLWDGFFKGTADSIYHVEVRLVNGDRDARLFSEDNIVKAWVSTKRRYPLAGATVEGACGPLRIHPKEPSGFVSEPRFVIREHDLTILRPHEIVFGKVSCAREVQRRKAAILGGPRPLSEQLLVQLYVFREANPERTDILHLMTLMAHCVTDGAANSTFMRCLVDTLARGSEPVQIPLEERLAMAIPTVELGPPHLRSLSPARRQWRRAAGFLIFQSRMAKRQGGHTLPCRITHSTPYTPAQSNRVATSLTHTQTTSVIANCRSHNLTFGNAFLVLAQVAMTRVLYRRYLRGDISEDEWAYRKKQPCISGGPLNLRPYLDKEWFDRGGGGEFMLSISLFYHELPFMTLGTTKERYHHDKHLSERAPDGAPPFSELLTFDKFLYRAGLAKIQSTGFFSHPLFYEIVRAISETRIGNTRLVALEWMKRAEAGNSDDSRVREIMDMPVVWTHSGSSLGNMDLISPTEYPLPPTHPLSPCSSLPHPARSGYVFPLSPSLPASEAHVTPTIVVESSQVHLHTRPAELYLGAASSRGRMNIYVFYDGNVFEEMVVKEWLKEVKEAVLWYLGRTHRQGGAQDTKRTARGGVQLHAKL